nr:nuclear pore complex protein NUP96 [Tanacetum cinerariifolium]
MTKRKMLQWMMQIPRSSGIAWGPNGLLLHCGSTAGNSDQKREMSSTIYIEKVATDNVVRDENNKTYHGLLETGRAPYPVPVYIDEGLRDFGILKTMFSAFASTYDPLDYHMIWHQRAVLEAVGTFSSDDLHVLDMGFVSQLLSLGQCHWAIYVVLHMPHRDDYSYLQATVIREILFQYCETWSAQENQQQFIENLGIPSAWLHEALAVYHAYYGNSFKALEHYLGCEFWQKANLTFITSVVHSLFMSGSQRYGGLRPQWKIINWDLGAGIYIKYYTLRSSLKEDESSMNEPVSLEEKNEVCRDFFDCLKESLAFWDTRLPIDARMVYAKMAEEISDLLVADSGEGLTPKVKLDCFNTIFDSPIPEDPLSCHLHSAVSHFTLYLTEAAS